MTLKTCLLVSDDPDDHQGFSEASNEISKGAVVLIILDSQKAIEFLKNTAQHFDFIFLDLSMHGIQINNFLEILRGEPRLRSIEIILYGDETELLKVEDAHGVTFFSKDYEYSELRDFLKEFI
ncbi:hypothetical protein KK083_21805 [Fulvivirgaceae bacterium PWU4]|uniref:Response regulatory domain-containing protein n=1 Tax=Chryseosolibacter histidini TaxID=2782349 RepID=A0AAP2GKY3_9BACT|nr:hypothetical protein [Chryseosolibacter histidini]MBT1699549.1 hypothetical protein [Chryseosolibacter histidini]